MSKQESHPYDHGAIYQAVRLRNNALRSRVHRLMAQTQQLDTSIGADQAKLDEIQEIIARLVAISANATELQSTASEIEQGLGTQRSHFDRLQRELTLVRDAMKYADMAHEALHWGGFADQALAKFDEEAGVASA